MTTQMDNFTATMIAEGMFDLAGVDPQDDEEARELVVNAYQHLIDTGLVWSLQGFFGRNARRLIDAGLCREAA